MTNKNNDLGCSQKWYKRRAEKENQSAMFTFNRITAVLKTF